MTPFIPMQPSHPRLLFKHGPARALTASVLGLTLALAGVSCSESATDPGADRGNPTVALLAGTPADDSQLAFSLNATDNLGLKTVRVRLEGGIVAAFDTTFTSAVTQVSLPFVVGVPTSVPIGTAVVVTATAVDGAFNSSSTDTLNLVVGNLEPPEVLITSPPSGTVAVVGKSVVLGISGKTALKVRAIGFQTTGVLTAVDSTFMPQPLRDSVGILDTLAIPSNTAAGALNVTAFMIDDLGQRILGSGITLNVQTAASTNSVPTVDFQIGERIEVRDLVSVQASDQTGIVAVGYEITDFTTNAFIARDSLTSNGTITSVPFSDSLNLNITTFPTKVLVKAFATNANGTRAYAKNGSVDRVDTVLVVAGSTRSLPLGGRLADALYHPGRDRLYLTNVELNQVEVFNLPDSTFRQPIIVGSRPWGITPWPRDRSGVMGDTLLVANSGGTSISYVNLNAGATGLDVFRYPLPNIIAYTVTSAVSQAGQIIRQRTPYDFSDRPQFIAATCQGGLTPASPCTDVVLVYSTTPTGGQSLPFPNRGTLRWENLTRRSSHFFFEQAMGQTSNRSDTLEVERFAAQGVGSDSVLVPFIQIYTDPITNVTTAQSIVVRIDQLAFRDTTFVRSSGNFRRAISGEGGSILGSRAVMFDPTIGFDMTFAGAPFNFLPVIDRGISRPLDVSDFPANTFARVRGVSINFDGEIAAIRGDSTYLIDPTLRLQGLLQTSGGNPGMDFHPLNTGPNSTPLSTRLAFAASAEPVIEIYDTYCYQRVGDPIPVRDPIIGPIKASMRPSGEIVLVGATSRGVVIVTVPNSFTTTCP